MQKRFQAEVTGRVQMVMYRDFTTRNARRLGLFGKVGNCSDGSVHVIAEGEESQLLALIDILKKGSLLSSVEGVQVVWEDFRGEFKNFTIDYTLR